MGKFILYPGYRNVFACMICKSSEVQCVECGSHACEHLVEKGSDGRACFCCIDPNGDLDWPDWSFTMVPEEAIRGKNGC